MDQLIPRRGTGKGEEMLAVLLRSERKPRRIILFVERVAPAEGIGAHIVYVNIADADVRPVLR